MDVRVCGPNLRDQSKGTFHVHAAGCPDLRKYGPQYRGKDAKGGDLNGNRELLIEDATIPKVVEAVYDNGIIDERLAEGESRADAIDSLMRDFWFAPCVGQLPYPEVSSTVVYECWVDDDRSSFAKLKADDKFAIAQHIMNLIKTLTPHQHLHLVAHYENEYTS